MGSQQESIYGRQLSVQPLKETDYLFPPATSLYSQLGYVLPGINWLKQCNRKM